MSLDRDARDLLACYGLTEARWTAHAFPRSRTWRGDSCGCTDDRCIGYHHGGDEPCRCLPALLDDFERASSWSAGDRFTRADGPPASS